MLAQGWALRRRRDAGIPGYPAYSGGSQRRSATLLKPLVHNMCTGASIWGEISAAGKILEDSEVKTRQYIFSPAAL